MGGQDTRPEPALIRVGKVIGTSNQKRFRWMLGSAAFGALTLVCVVLLVDFLLHMAGVGFLPFVVMPYGMILAVLGLLLGFVGCALSTMVLLFRDRIIFGDDAVQFATAILFSRFWPDCHIPYENVAAVKRDKDKEGAKRLVIELIDPKATGTHIPKQGERFIVEDNYAVDLAAIQSLLEERCTRLRAKDGPSPDPVPMARRVGGQKQEG